MWKGVKFDPHDRKTCNLSDVAFFCLATFNMFQSYSYNSDVAK